MKELVVLSGKGGTGKTSLTAAFAALSERLVLCDADVDASDLHLIMAPENRTTTDFLGGGIAVINSDMCTECGTCRDLCRFDAIDENFEVDPISCEGCGVCVDFCPEKAIDFPIQTCGQWFLAESRFGPMVHARLGIAEENSGKLVTLVRQEARKLAEKNSIDFILTDGPPGVGCPVIASAGGATAVVLVAEPTVSGLHDMKRVADLAAFFKVPCMACVNKFDLNPDQADAIEKVCAEKKVQFLGTIPFDPVFMNAMVQGKTIIEYEANSDAGDAVKKIWNRIKENLARLN